MLRSLLFMPGNSPGMLIHADTLGADAVILDLEDAVPPAEKDAARCLVRHALDTPVFAGRNSIVRVNAISSPYFADDAAAIVPLRPAFLLLPKVDSAADVTVADEVISAAEAACGLPIGTVALMPLIETALGVEHAFLILTAAKRVRGVLLGAEDLCADLGCARTRAGTEILYSRSRVVLAARAASVPCFDTPFTDAADDEGAKSDAQFARALGFTGKAAVSPRHVPLINEAFSPSSAEIEYAAAVVAALKKGREQGAGVVSLNGKMIDAPVEARAKRVLETARRLGVYRDED